MTLIQAIIPTLGIWELLIIGAVALVVFGNRLPSAMRSLGQSFVAFKSGLREGEQEESDTNKSSIDKSGTGQSAPSKPEPLALEHKSPAPATGEAAQTISLENRDK